MSEKLEKGLPENNLGKKSYLTVAKESYCPCRSRVKFFNAFKRGLSTVTPARNRILGHVYFEIRNSNNTWQESLEHSAS